MTVLCFPGLWRRKVPPSMRIMPAGQGPVAAGSEDAAGSVVGAAEALAEAEGESAAPVALAAPDGEGESAVELGAAGGEGAAVSAAGPGAPDDGFPHAEARRGAKEARRSRPRGTP